MLQGALIATLVFPFAGAQRRRAHVRTWSSSLLEILAVRLVVRGAQPGWSETPLMLVANHISWLDVFAINAVLPVCYVAKSEVRSWPLVGWLSTQAGTLYIERGRRRGPADLSTRLVQLMREGNPVAVFPEGTSTDGSEVRDFHASLLQPAVLAGARLLPVAVSYVRADGTPCSGVAFIDDMSLWDSLRLVTGERGIRAELAFLPALATEGRHRRELARAARAAILQSLSPRVLSSQAERARGPRAAAR